MIDQPGRHIDLRIQLDALTSDVDSRCATSYDTRLPLLAHLSDDQIWVLQDLLYTEGLARGFGTYWNE